MFTDFLSEIYEDVWCNITLFLILKKSVENIYNQISMFNI